MIAHSGNLYAGSDLQEDMASGKPCSSGNWEGKWEGLGSDRRWEAKGRHTQIHGGTEAGLFRGRWLLLDCFHCQTKCVVGQTLLGSKCSFLSA